MEGSGVNPMELISPMLDYMTSWHGPPLVIMFLIVNGYMLKMVRVFPNRFIPLVNMGLSVVLTVFVVNWPDPAETWMVKVKWPAIAAWATVLMQGLLFNFAAWALHAKLLRKWIDEKVPGMSESATDIKRRLSEPGPVP